MTTLTITFVDLVMMASSTGREYLQLLSHGSASLMVAGHCFQSICSEAPAPNAAA